MTKGKQKYPERVKKSLIDSGDDVIRRYYTQSEVSRMLGTYTQYLDDLCRTLDIEPMRYANRLKKYTREQVEVIAMGFYLKAQFGMSAKGILNYIRMATEFESLPAIKQGIVELFNKSKKESDSKIEKYVPIQEPVSSMEAGIQYEKEFFSDL